jgi:phosphate acyltransferase
MSNRLKPSAHTCRVGIDLLGSDTSPKQLMDAICAFKAELKPCIQLTLFGLHDLAHCALPDGILFHTASQAIEMQDDPLYAVRRKKDSSLYLGVQMLKEGHLDAFISSGNTGALMAASKLLLSTLPGVDRPALLTLLPTRKAEIAVLDVGANTSYKAKHLLQFALMGAAFQKSRGITHPKVGLLNVGAEAKKGTPELRTVYESLKKMPSPPFLFVGNIEAREVFQGGIDVLVTDGFTGNVFLKTAEGIAVVILNEIEESMREQEFSHLNPTLTKLRHHLHFAKYPGALLAGVDGIVIKCHSNASIESVLSSIISAARLTEHHFLDCIKN